MRVRPNDGDPVPAGRTLLRLPRPPPDFTPDNYRPSDAVYIPSSDDKRHAEERNRPVRVSVWDHALTSIDQARSFREGATIVLSLEVSSLDEVSSLHGQTLSAVYDALDESDASRPGAEGHAGIEGLQRGKGMPRPKHRAMLADLADRTVLVQGLST